MRYATVLMAALPGGILAGGLLAAGAPTQFQAPAEWQYTAPLLSPEKRATDQSIAQKDPSIVFAEGKWHVFASIKCPGFTPIEYCSFSKWEDADKAPRTILRISDSKYYCAPQVFYFRPQKKWYLIYQMGVPNSPKKFMWLAYSTTTTISDPNSWTKAQPALAGDEKDPRQVGGLDYWIICDDQRAYFFFTSLNGKLWRMWTKLEEFPNGFGHCEVALQADIFEASHTYKLKGLNRYLTIIEAGQSGKRYYKAYLADALDGKWTPLADTEQKPFAGEANCRPAPGVEAWADNISHGELVRATNDETMTVDPRNLQFVFQGVLEKQKTGGYGQIPWRLGILTPAKGP